MPEITLRPYQIRDLQSVRDNMRAHRSVLLVQPTGSGKGTIATFIVAGAAAKSKRILFLVNRRTLVHDMAKRLERLGIEHGVIMGDDPRRKPWLSVHVASIDTLHRREPLPPADLLILDEAHFCVSPTWAKVLACYPQAKVLGMTATPIRVDGRGLGEIFESLVLGPAVVELIADGFLVPSRVFAPSTPNMSGVRTMAGEFNSAQLSHVCDTTKLVGDIVEHWKKYSPDRKTAVFGVDQKHARHIAEEFRVAGVDCAYVDANTPDEERERIWIDLDHGRLPMVSSVGVISYGWDHPIVSTVILARPTASLGLHLQQIGRGARPCAGKADLLVLDHAGNTNRHGFYEDARTWSLDGAAMAAGNKVRQDSICTCRNCFGAFHRGRDACPYCGHPVPKQYRDVEVVTGELVERKMRTMEEWRSVGGDERRARYLEFVKIAREKKYNPKWAKVKYRAMFGKWPGFEGEVNV